MERVRRTREKTRSGVTTELDPELEEALNGPAREPLGPGDEGRTVRLDYVPAGHRFAHRGTEYLRVRDDDDEDTGWYAVRLSTGQLCASLCASTAVTYLGSRGEESPAVDPERLSDADLSDRITEDRGRSRDALVEREFRRMRDEVHEALTAAGGVGFGEIDFSNAERAEEARHEFRVSPVGRFLRNCANNGVRLQVTPEEET